MDSWVEGANGKLKCRVREVSGPRTLNTIRDYSQRCYPGLWTGAGLKGLTEAGRPRDESGVAGAFSSPCPQLGSLFTCLWYPHRLKPLRKVSPGKKYRLLYVFAEVKSRRFQFLLSTSTKNIRHQALRKVVTSACISWPTSGFSWNEPRETERAFVNAPPPSPNRLFYSCLFSDLAFEWQRGWRLLWDLTAYCFVHKVVPILTSCHYNEIGREVCIKTGSPPAWLEFIGQATKHTTVKWPIPNYQNMSTNLFKFWDYFP